jgi:hypothetical protein
MQAREFRILTEVLAACPSLWPFTSVAGLVGIDAARDACRTRTIPEALRAEFARVGYTADHLPTLENADLMLLGVRLEALREVRAAAGESRTLPELARALGADPRTAHRAYDLLRALGYAHAHNHRRRFGHGAEGGGDPVGAPGEGRDERS